AGWRWAGHRPIVDAVERVLQVAEHTFATAINCIDGRAQDPVAEWMRGRFGVRYVDTITEAGADGILANELEAVLEPVKSKVMVSTGAHKSRVVAVVGHYGCAGNPVAPEDHLEDIRKGVDVVASWGLPVDVIGLWVNDQWQVEVVCETGRNASGPKGPSPAD
ncbi:carbonic anhydrase, partial [Nitrolancea hollandica]|uniref:carbonic anhydrase n=1 Tax=Nitrolancea hollandica TaxID=1206749 RepID=UPI001EE64BA8